MSNSDIKHRNLVLQLNLNGYNLIHILGVESIKNSYTMNVRCKNSAHQYSCRGIGGKTRVLLLWDKTYVKHTGNEQYVMQVCLAKQIRYRSLYQLRPSGQTRPHRENGSIREWLTTKGDGASEMQFLGARSGSCNTSICITFQRTNRNADVYKIIEHTVTAFSDDG